MAATNASGGSAFKTNRKDWDTLVEELYSGVIAGTAFGIGVAAKSKGLLGASLKLRLNQRFPSAEVTNFVKGHFKLKILEKLFESDSGLVAEPGGNLFKVASNELGLPRNTIVFRFENPADTALRAVMLFGGERMATQLESRLSIATAILEGRTAAGKVDLSLMSPEDLKIELGRLNLKRLFDYDLAKLSVIINGLEDSKEELSKTLKPAFKTVSDYIIKKRVRR